MRNTEPPITLDPAGHSPVRPNHLGVLACALLQVAGLGLTVQGSRGH